MSEGGFEKGMRRVSEERRVSEKGMRGVSEERRVSEKSGAAIPQQGERRPVR